MAGLTAGIDLGGTKMLALANWEGQRITQTYPTGKAFTLEQYQANLAAFLARLPASPECLGVAIPGLVSLDGRQVVASHPLPGISGLPVDAFGLPGRPVYLINDAEAALVEESAGLAANATAAIIMAGTAIGMGIKTNGQIVRGSQGWSGELGKAPVATLDGVHNLDELAGGAAILQRLDMTFAQAGERIRQGDPGVLAVLQEAGFYFGLGIATTINLLNPELVILGGGTLNFPGYLEAALQSARQNTWPDLWQACTVRRALDEKLVVALGALRYARQGAGFPD